MFSGPDRARVGIRTHRFRNCFLVASPSNCRVTRGSLRFRGGRSPAIAVRAKWGGEMSKKGCFEKIEFAIAFLLFIVHESDDLEET